MYCEKCGYKLRRGVKSCAQCGAQTPYNHSRSVIQITVAVILVIIGFVAVMIVDNGKSTSAVVIDICTVAVMFVGLFVGVRRGFLYGTVSTILLTVVFAVSFFVSQTATPVIYDSFIKNPVINAVDNAVVDSSPAQHMVDSVDEVISRDDGLYIIIEFLSDELTDSVKATDVATYIQLTGIENTESNYVYSERYLNGELVGTDSNGTEYDNRRNFAYILAESWVEKCLPEYESFDDLCATLTSLIDGFRSADAETKTAAEIREMVENDVLGILIGNDFFMSSSIVNCVEYIIGEEAVDTAVDNVIWAYLTSDSVGQIAESGLFEPLIVCCLRIVIFLILVLVLRFIVSFVMKIFKLLEGIHTPYVLDLIFGAVEGIAGGAAWLCYAAVAAETAIIVVMLFGNDLNSVISETIESTAVFRIFCQTVGRLGI